MADLEMLRSRLPDGARDIKLNLQSVLQSNSLSSAQVWGVAITSAATARNASLLSAVLTDARRAVDEKVVDDALAAAALMGMNNVYYRFRHLVGKESYGQKPARLRMNRLVKPATNKVDFELFCLAASAINACEACIRAHEQVVTQAGLSEDAVHDAVRIAATVNAAALALELPAEPAIDTAVAASTN